MTAAVPFPAPPGGVLSAWRREFTPPPRRFFLAHLLLHRVEALVRVAAVRPLDAFDAALLGQLAAGADAGRLRLDPGALARWAHRLAAEGLIEWNADGPRLLDKGRAALEAGAYPSPTEERRGFTFVERGAGRPPAFLALHGPGETLSPPPDWRFDPAVLEACVRRPPEWKARHGFPADVEAVAAPPARPAAADWRRVVLYRLERILLIFVRSEDESGRGWQGHVARREGGALLTASPAVVLRDEDGGPEALPELTEEPSPAAWREAWREWCAGRGVGAADADACRLEVGEAEARAVAPGELARRLGGRPDEWLLAGAGRVRVAVPLVIQGAS